MSKLLEKALEKVGQLPEDLAERDAFQILDSITDEDTAGETLPFDDLL
jgi:hypothetical protein